MWSIQPGTRNTTGTKTTRTRATTPDDPWSNLIPPAQSTRISARRVAHPTPWNLYWAVDADRQPLLILQHGRRSQQSGRPPKLRGLRVESTSADNDSDERIIIRLTDREQKDIFLRFCRDIIDATVLAKTEEQAVKRFLSRTWRWHRLLQRGRDDRLSDQEQKGLIGELSMVKKHLLPLLGSVDAIRCWTGPLGTPQDFEISGVHIESKAQGTAALVTISSEHQLELGHADKLFLHVTDVVSASEGTENAFTLTQIAQELRSTIAKQDMVAMEHFEERLNTVGFHWTDDYSDKLWLVVGESLYEVREGFPRITSRMFPGGVGNVRYTISLPDCEAFRVTSTALTDTISGDNDGF